LRAERSNLMYDKNYYVYFMTNKHNSVIYTGVTGNLVKRIWEHRNNVVEGFTAKYQVHKLVYYEAFGDVYLAISREKQIKAGSRQKKIDLINKINPEWRDLYESII